MASTKKIRLLIWSEHREHSDAVKKIYPNGIHGALAGHFQKTPDIEVRTATMDEPEHGLTDKILSETDVLMWWGHRAHHEVDDKVVDRIQRRVLQGMGLIALHSSHFSKIFLRLMGTSGTLRWRNANEIERIWVINPAHPIAQGIEPYIELREEMYGEPFDIPPPDELIFISWFEGGEVFRSGATWQRGKGKVFYFRPGHETNPTYHHPAILRVLENAVRWAVFSGSTIIENRGHKDSPPLSPIQPS